ncbi:hypothetical protein OS493_039256 [Desmophyllum pertusum]|uniref:Uncharacterized protein n=1 Tax=Desmophyllum pertusum TaxID=174260 RepID=A0A9X0CDS3_9CNID|nr:hypothetical protein OS493_039256 [Desmophyllum pertusum]
MPTWFSCFCNISNPSSFTSGDESDTEARKTFHVRITDDSLQLVREKRQQFLKEVTTSRANQLWPQSVYDKTYPISIETVAYSQGTESVTQRHSFLVTNYFCGGKLVSPWHYQQALKIQRPIFKATCSAPTIAGAENQLGQVCQCTLMALCFEPEQAFISRHQMLSKRIWLRRKADS